MKRVVLDTNIVVSGVLFGGVPRKILDALENELFKAVATPLILAEYERALKKVGKDFGDLAVEEFMAAYLELIEISEDFGEGHFCRDPDDDKFIHCAFAAGADAIISGDDDLLVLKSIRNIPILRPSAFLDKLR